MAEFFSFAAHSAVNEKKFPLRTLRLCGEPSKQNATTY